MTDVSKRLLIILGAAILAATGAGCSTTDSTNATNTNATVASSSTRLGPDNSEITTSVDANGVKTETRVFHNNPRVAKVVVTTRNGKRTTTVYAPSGESKDLGDNVGEAMSATGTAVAHSAAWGATRSEDVA